MNTKHTPAPWRFDQEEMKIKGIDDVNFYTVIANVSPKMDYSRGMTTQCANAKLIAAAPELLEALQEVVKISDRKHDAWDKAKAAIKKATE